MQVYDRIAAGDRIRQRRLLLGMTQEELAEKIGRAYKYCQDIERGSCGMSPFRAVFLLGQPRCLCAVLAGWPDRYMGS